MNHSFYLILVILFCITSCKGQEKNKIREIQINSSSGDTLTTESVWVDDQFFIEGQLCQHLRKIFQDSKGNLWFGTNVYDIMRYDGIELKYFKEIDTGRITGIAEDDKGNVWFGTSQGLTKFDGKSFTQFAEKDGLLNNEIWSFVIDKMGVFWIGTNAGVYTFDGSEFASVSLPKPNVKEVNTIYSEDRITGIVEDEKGNLWFGTDGYGICKYDGKAFENFTKDDGLCDNTISELMVDSKNNLWVGTYWGGVSKYDGKNFVNFTKEGVISGVEVGAFFESDNGDIWFGAENSGVYRYSGESFTNFNKEHGLLTNGILSIYEDKENRFWFGGWGGLFRFDGSTFYSVTKDGPWTK